MENRNKDMTDRGVENNVRGTGNDMKGRAKDAVGGLTGDNQMQAEGKWDKAKGKAQDTAGDIQRKIGNETNKR